MAELIWQLLPRLRSERDLTVAELSRITVRQGNDVPQKSIEALESQSRAGQVPKAHTLRALAEALGVPPGSFYEWPIAEAQEARKRAVKLAEGVAERVDRRAPKGT